MSNDPVTRTRMLDALTKIQRLEKQADQQIKSRFQSYVAAAPATLRRNGLGQALAMWRSRAGSGSAEEKAYQALYAVLERWLCGDHALASYRGERDLLGCIAASSQEQYLEAQNEAELYLNWIKKFANALLTTGGANGDTPAA